MRSLSLRKESLAELTAGELSAVPGAGPLTDTCVSVRCTGLMCLYSDAICLED